MMAEFYKLMVSQKGILVVAGIIIALIYINPIPDVKFMGFQEGYNDFIHEYVGEPSERSEEGLAELQALVDEEDARHMQVLELYDEGKASAQDAATSEMLHSSLEYRRNLLEKLMEQTQYVQSVRDYKGIDAWYVNYKHAAPAFEYIIDKWCLCQRREKDGYGQNTAHNIYRKKTDA